jgi:hypothetical protein
MWSTAAVGAFSRRTAVDVLQNRKWSSVARHHPFTPNEPDINTKFIQKQDLAIPTRAFEKSQMQSRSA